MRTGERLTALQLKGPHSIDAVALSPDGMQVMTVKHDPVSIDFFVALSSPRGRAGERVPRRRGSEARGGPPAEWREAHTERGSPVATAQRPPRRGPGEYCAAEKPGGSAPMRPGPRGNPEHSARAGHAPRGRTRSRRPSR
jgi:hypothetical protein